MSPRLWAAAYYHLSFAALGAIFPLLPFLAAARNMDSVEIGLLLAIGPAANALIPPAWGRLADGLRARATLLALASFGCAGAVWLLAVTSGTSGTVGAVAALWLVRAPLVPLADATARTVLGARGLAFGRIRAWGSLGYAVAVAAAGAAGISRHLLPIVAGSSAAYLAAAGAALSIGDARASDTHPAAPTARPRARGSGLSLLFLAATGLYGGAHAISDGFFPVYVRALGHSEALVGYAWGAAVGLEIIVMLLAPRLLARIDALRLLQIAVAAGAVRWWGVALTTSATALFALQLIHAVSFGLWYVALVEAVQRAAPPERRATAQGVATSAIGVGQLVGFVGGGELFTLGGAPAAFGVAGIAALVAAGVYGALAGTARQHALTG